MRGVLLRLGWLLIVAALGAGCRTTTVFRHTSAASGWEATFPGERLRGGWSSQLVDTGNGVLRVERGVTVDVRLVFQVLALELPTVSPGSRVDRPAAAALLATVRERIRGLPDAVLVGVRQVPSKEHVVASEELRYRGSDNHQAREYAARVVVSEAGLYLAIVGWEESVLDSEWLIEHRQEVIARFFDSLTVRASETADASASAAPEDALAALAEGLKYVL